MKKRRVLTWPRWESIAGFSDGWVSNVSCSYVTLITKSFVFQNPRFRPGFPAICRKLHSQSAVFEPKFFKIKTWTLHRRGLRSLCEGPLSTYPPLNPGLQKPTSPTTCEGSVTSPILRGCHIMIPVLDLFLAGVVFLKDHFERIIRFKPVVVSFLWERVQPRNVISKDWNLKNPLEQWNKKTRC